VNNPKAMLVFPADADLRALSQKRIPLTFSSEHELSRNGHVFLVDGDGEILMGEAFRRMRVKLGAWIETDSIPSVCKALYVPVDEPGIMGVAPAGPSKGALPT
jgi:hypothetical protein